MRENPAPSIGTDTLHARGRFPEDSRRERGERKIDICEIAVVSLSSRRNADFFSRPQRYLCLFPWEGDSPQRKKEK